MRINTGDESENKEMKENEQVKKDSHTQGLKAIEN